ncbi:MAG: sensor histidine kinase [Planctomycetota bacterium]|jgi:signal transduction histidine kinase
MQLALHNTDDSALCEKALQKSLLFAERAGTMLEKIMAVAGSGKAETQHYALNKILDDVFTCIGRDFEKDKIRVVRDFDSDVEVWADATAISQVLMNLLLNARQAMLEKGGRLTIAAQQTANGTLIQISDTGCGIDPQRLKDIFTPFYTAGKKNGNGLGLAFCRTVIEAHGGYIQADSRPDEGTTFKILLPKHPI